MDMFSKLILLDDFGKNEVPFLIIFWLELQFYKEELNKVWNFLTIIFFELDFYFICVYWLILECYLDIYFMVFNL
jgi:hypothetical protein